MPAYYNEIDPFAAAWLRELIKAGLIAPGDVDQRSIVDVHPDDLRGYAQCHFFAGIGVWSHALRRAGWPDGRPVWTGSCPCQPFSAAGKGAGFADERHLWPAFYHLISACAPVAVFGEQVASADGLAWLDLVQSDLEGAGYAFGAVDTCAAGFGAPHIRQRLYWVADALRGEQRWIRESRQSAERAQFSNRGRSPACGLADSARQQHDRARIGGPGRGLEHSDRRAARGLADAAGFQEHQEQQRPTDHEGRRSADEFGGRRVADTGTAAHPTDGHWRDADWLLCRDGKWRPVEPAFKQMADGITLVLGHLRHSGENREIEEAINAASASPYAGKILREMWEGTAPEAVWLQAGRQVGFYEATILFSFLLQHAGKLGRFVNSAEKGSSEECRTLLRELRKNGQAACASPGPEYPQQLDGQFKNTLSKLPQTGALEILKTLNGFPLAHGAANRVGRLRGYGNAIVAAQAEGFVMAFMSLPSYI